VDQSPYRSAQASYQLDMATPIYAQTIPRSAGRACSRLKSVVLAVISLTPA
jgi:hypothetical protein